MVEVDGLIPPELVAELAKSAKMVRGTLVIVQNLLEMVGGGAFVAAAQLVDRVARHRSGVLMTASWPNFWYSDTGGEREHPERVFGDVV